MAQPWLSVILPTYNGMAYLPAALESICAEADDRIEVLAIDDGSTDGTVNILQKYQAHLPLRLIQRGRVGNWVANSNYGLELARGVYACFLHQDDVWLPGRLRTMQRLITTAPGASLALHPAWFIDPCGQKLGQWRCPLPMRRCVLTGDDVLARLITQNFIAMPAPVFRRATALRVGGMDESLWFTADWDLWLKLAAAGETVYHPQPLAAFRIHPESQTAVRTARIQDLRTQLERVQQRHSYAWHSNETIRTLAQLSTEVTLALAALAHRQRPDWQRLLAASLRLRPTAWYRLLHDSRLAERVRARMKLARAMGSRIRQPVLSPAA